MHIFTKPPSYLNNLHPKHLLAKDPQQTIFKSTCTQHHRSNRVAPDTLQS